MTEIKIQCPIFPPFGTILIFFSDIEYQIFASVIVGCLCKFVFVVCDSHDVL
jgi:hypothetical protein